ncbi:uncharacterized protein TRUGW13939_09242 [Talaromyces rugulosus]|uniref:Uncharacterized protein n=1 Tax=Talaromyces rugulosus TaxID=121627 RepID=A0A7H8R7A6_TALRU|nr:uncharacterized protein TRUGW13939_09242 [Talaromyces rugulosus]QKX62086.1 hypothetical protein TRUGW13939_09242 [Talaromyces rugulosus]
MSSCFPVWQIYSTVPSVLLVIDRFGATIRVLHLLPENSTVIERFSSTSSTITFRYGKVREQTREQIGTVTLDVGDGETAESFLDDVATRIPACLRAKAALGVPDRTPALNNAPSNAYTANAY